MKYKERMAEIEKILQKGSKEEINNFLAGISVVEYRLIKIELSQGFEQDHLGIIIDQETGEILEAVHHSCSYFETEQNLLNSKETEIIEKLIKILNKRR